jgi:aminopeptidase N
VLSIFRYGQEDAVAPFLDQYLEAAETVIDTLGFHKGSVVLEYGFPKALGSPQLIERVDAWLADNTAPKGAVRYVREGRADVARALAAQARDAQA